MLDRTCVRVARELEGANEDPIVLWRLARTLKAVNRDLLRIAQRLDRIGADTAQAHELLSAVEVHLRTVLLDEGSLRPAAIREQVEWALHGVLDVLAVVEQAEQIAHTSSK